MDHDVIVIGAGLAGLSAADALTESGYDVLVLEREEEIGGRQRTEEIDGFLSDRGFQVLNPAYPAVRRWIDVKDLDLQAFGAGVLVRNESGLATLAHPFREPLTIPRTLASGLLQPGEIGALTRWLAPVLVAPKQVLRGADRTLAEGLDRAGVRGPLRTRVLEPFIAGVMAEDSGATSEVFVKLLVRMFALGVPGLPARGIRALPEQVAARVWSRKGRIHRGKQVVQVSETADGVGVEVADGSRSHARAVLFAVGPEVASELAGVPPVATKGLTTWWFAAEEPPSKSDMLAVDGTRSGPLVNTAVVSNAVPAYAPKGRHLVQATALLKPGTTISDDAARHHAGRIWGSSTDTWELLVRHDIPHALPAQPPPLRTTSKPSLGPRRFVCGDYRDSPSIQGALVSGRRVAQAVFESLRAS